MDVYSPTCKDCKEFDEKAGRISPCATCKTILLPENEDAALIYMRTRGQVITRGMDGVIVDISIPAIKDAMDAKGIPQARQWEVMDQVHWLFWEVRRGQE